MCGRTLDGVIEKLPQVDFCCCGCKLSTGTKIIGWITFLVNILLEIVWVSVVVGWVIVSRNPHGNPSKVPDKDTQNTVLVIVLIVGSLVALMIVLSIAVAAILLLGVYKNDMKKLRCWLQINLVFFIMGLTSSGLGVFALVIANPAEGIARLTESAISYGLAFYFIIVVKSHYTEQMAVLQLVSADHS